MMNHIKMQRLTQFPIENLHSSLKTELLELLEPKEFTDMTKVNGEFRSLALTNVEKLFGEHVYSIVFEVQSSVYADSNCSFEVDDGCEISIKKFPNSWPIMLDLTRYSILASTVRFCNLFDFGDFYVSEWGVRGDDAVKKLLENIEEIGQLLLRIGHLFDEILGDLLVFTGEVTDTVVIHMDSFNDLLIGEQEYFIHFLETRFGFCKRMQIICDRNDLAFFYVALHKTHVEELSFATNPTDIMVDRDLMTQFVEQIVTGRASNSNPWVSIFIFTERINLCGFVKLLGAQVVNGEEYSQLLIARMPHNMLGDGGWQGMMESVQRATYFTKSIDSNRKWLLVTSESGFFFAKVIASQ